MIKKVRDYTIISLIGKGAYGAVYKVSKNNEYFGMKIFSLALNNRKDLDNVENETKILSKLNNEYCIKMYETFKFELGIAVVMELCENGDLSKIILDRKEKNLMFSENEIKNYFYEICKGLEYLHKNRIIHRDLKTMNIFITKDNHIKIGDFGVSKILTNNNIYAYTIVGTPYYISPEICQNKPYDEKTDMWSLGCVLYEMITFNKPFESNSQMGLFMKILKEKPQKLNDNVRKTYSTRLLNLIYDLLQKNPNKRFGLKQIFHSGIFYTFNNIKNLKNTNNNNIQNKKSFEIKNVNNYNNINNNINNNPPIIRPKLSSNSGAQRVRTNPNKKNIDNNNNKISRRAIMAFNPKSNNNNFDFKEIHKNNKYSNTLKEKITINKDSKKIPLKYNNNEINKEKITTIKKTNTNNLSDKDLSATSFMKKVMKGNFNEVFKDDNDSTLDGNNNNNNNKNNISSIKKSQTFGNTDYSEIFKKDYNDNVNEFLNEYLDNNYEDEDNNDNNYFEEENYKNLKYLNNLEMPSPEIKIKDIKYSTSTSIINNNDTNNKISDEINENNNKKLEEKDKKLNDLINEANREFGETNINDIFDAYKKYQDNLSDENTKKLDELIFKKLNNDQKKYENFLEIFYKIIYLKYLKQTDE